MLPVGHLNSREGGPQKNSKYQEQETGPGLVFVEGGTFTMGRVQDDPMHDWNNYAKPATCSIFLHG